MTSRPAAGVAGGPQALAGLQSLAHMIRKRAVEHPDRVAFISPARSWTYAELDAQSNRIAQGLVAAGIGAGDCVASLTRHAGECILLLLAANKLDAVMSPMNWRLSAGEIDYAFALARPRLLIADAFMAPTLAQLRGEVRPRQLVTDSCGSPDSLADWASSHAAVDPGAQPRLDDVSTRLFSSGTTGFPKAVDLSHRGILVHCIEWTEPFGYRQGDTVHLNVLPTFHVSGVVNALWMLFLGSTAVFLPEFNPQRYLEAIGRHHVTDAFAVPAMLKSMVECPEIHTTDLSSMRCIAYGGSPIDESLLKRCLADFGCGFLQVYGMTEASGTLTALLPQEHDPGGPRAWLLRSVGRAGRHIELRVVRSADGSDCPEGEVGEPPRSRRVRP